MDYQQVIVVGNITRDAERSTSQQGDVAHTRFSVAVSDGRERTAYFPVMVFGQMSANLTEYLTKGRQVLVRGCISVSENGQFNLIGDRVELGVMPQKVAEPTAAKHNRQGYCLEWSVYVLLHEEVCCIRHHG